MIPIRFAFAIAAGLAVLAAPVRSAPSESQGVAERALERAVHAKGPEALIRARATFETRSKGQPKSAALHYWIAVADWRLVPRLDDPEKAQRFCRDGLDHADQALKLDPGSAEALAIKAALQGLWLRLDSGSMMTIGMEIESNLHRAVELGPRNPRVHLIDGINTFHKPAFVGGGPDKALPRLEKALDLFAADSAAGAGSPMWGRLDAHIWAGRSALAIGDVARARTAYEHALEIDPENGWVRGSLLPELEKAVAAQAAAKDAP